MSEVNVEVYTSTYFEIQFHCDIPQEILLNFLNFKNKQKNERQYWQY